MPASRPYRILMLEDSAAAAELIAQELPRWGIAAVWQRVDTEPTFKLALRAFAPDIILSDHSLAAFDAPAAIRVVQAMHQPIPFIVVSGSLDERRLVECLRAGAEDYIPKSDLGRLAAVIQPRLPSLRPLSQPNPPQREVLQPL